MGPYSKDDLCQVWLELAQWFWRRSKKCEKFKTNGWADSSGELKSPENYLIYL
jgi:hypothetical protein